MNRILQWLDDLAKRKDYYTALLVILAVVLVIVALVNFADVSIGDLWAVISQW